MKVQSSAPLLFLLMAVDPARARRHDQRAITSDPCETATTLPTITVTQSRSIEGAPGGRYEQCYTVTYPRWGPNGLQPQPYTVTETCDDVVCRGPTETALPPGFTHAAVACASCGEPGEVLTETLTFPVESAAAWKASGYVINGEAVPTQEATPGGGDMDGQDEGKDPQDKTGQKPKGDGNPAPPPVPENDNVPDKQLPAPAPEPENTQENPEPESHDDNTASPAPEPAPEGENNHENQEPGSQPGPENDNDGGATESPTAESEGGRMPSQAPAPHQNPEDDGTDSAPETPNLGEDEGSDNVEQIVEAGASRLVERSVELVAISVLVWML